MLSYIFINSHSQVSDFSKELGAALINHLPYKLGAAGWIPGFFSLSDETKLWPCPHITLAVCGTLAQTNKERVSN